MTVNEYRLPDVGEGLTEAEIVAWRVQVGDEVKVNDVVVEIETAKSLVELPSPYAGTVAALHAREGETVAVGTPIIAISDPAESARTYTPDPAESARTYTPDPVESARMHEMDLSNPSAGRENATLVGYGPRSGTAMRRARRGPATAPTLAGSAAQMQVQGSFALGKADTSEVVPADEPPVPAVSARSGETAKPSGAWSVGKVLAKPPVRKLARDLGVELGSVTPSGAGGVVTAEDVQAAAAGVHVRADSAGSGRTFTPTRQLEERREPIKGVRKRMGQAMVASAFTIPHVTEWVSVDVTATMRLVKRLRLDPALAGVKVSPLVVVAKAVCLAMRRTPEVNARWDDDAQEVVYSGSVHLGIAAATDRGLVVPNVKGADAMSLAELAGAIQEAVSTARDGRTQPADMAGGTFTITNVGVFGIDAGTPIINPGESAILAFGAVRKQPWVHRGRVRPRDVSTLALSFDHRFIDGALGSRFLADVAGILEDPAQALRF